MGKLYIIEFQALNRWYVEIVLVNLDAKKVDDLLTFSLNRGSYVQHFPYNILHVIFNAFH